MPSKAISQLMVDSRGFTYRSAMRTASRPAITKRVTDTRPNWVPIRTNQKVLSASCVAGSNLEANSNNHTAPDVTASTKPNSTIQSSCRWMGASTSL